ncbi:MAG TPA: hypothetical protein VJB06_02400 [archaeon]|nr:hypothetical protein [archaeon]
MADSDLRVLEREATANPGDVKTRLALARAYQRVADFNNSFREARLIRLSEGYNPVGDKYRQQLQESTLSYAATLPEPRHLLYDLVLPVTDRTVRYPAGTVVQNRGISANEIHMQSITQEETLNLWHIYLRSQLGQRDIVDQETLGVIIRLFETNRQSDIWTNDACDYNRGKKTMKRVKPTDRRVRWVKSPEKFQLVGSEWRATGGEDHFILVQETGYVELTVDGAYRPDTGSPFSTVETRQEAEQSWIKRGFVPEFAERAVGCFYSRKEEGGTSSVVRWFDDLGSGRFILKADDNPGSRGRAYRVFRSQ